MRPAIEKDMARIEERVHCGDRLTREDGLTLLQSPDLLRVGELADEARTRTSDNYVYFNVNRHINLTNVCTSRCQFCAFSCDSKDPQAYTLSVDQVVKKAQEAVPMGITEVHIVSGLHPDLPFDYYVGVLRELKTRMPSVHIQAFTAVEIKYFSDISGLSVRETLQALKEAGLGSLPGGGAEIFSDRIRTALCPKKASADEWIEVMRTAHEIGLRSNATMLYGHIETDDEVIGHLIRLRDLQDETGGFQSFIPLPFHPENTKLHYIERVSAVEQLRMFAVSRLMLDNFDHIKAFWIMVGLKVAQIALSFGVDDLDGTVVEERIVHSAGARTEQGITKQELARMIREAHRVPVERDTLYNVLSIYA